MASISEIIASLQSSVDKINEAITAASAAESDTEEMQNQMAAMGVQDKVNELALVKDAIDKAKAHLSGGVDVVNAAIDLARGVEGA